MDEVNFIFIEKAELDLSEGTIRYSVSFQS